MREFLSRLRRTFWESPLDFFDNIELFTLRGKKVRWGIRDERFRYIAALVSFVTLGAWIYFGFDSTIHYFASQQELLSRFFGFTRHFGAGLHWSSISMYAMFYFLISYWLAKDEKITGTRNFFFSAMALFVAGGVFEIVWMSLYDVIHFADPILWNFGDGMIFWRNVLWILCLPMIYLVLRAGTQFRPKYNHDWRFLALGLMTLMCWAIWITAPFPHVTYQGGGNVGSSLFPQTVYTVNIMAEGGKSLEAVYIPNDFVHLTNVVVKYITTIAFLSFFRVKVVHKDTGERWVDWCRRQVKG